LEEGISEGKSKSKKAKVYLPIKSEIDLRSLGISKAQADELRFKFRTIAEDWEKSEMDIYNIV
jgi:hypothetical protein